MAPKTTDLKKKLDEAKAAAKEKAKSPKEKLKEKKDAEEKAKAEKKKKEKLGVAEAPTPARAPEPVVPVERPSVFSLPGEEIQEVGIHLGVSCDGCGCAPPLIGRAMKCKDCPDFDLCEQCWPDRLDQQREIVAAAAGMPGRGRHPGAHKFGARRAGVVMTREAANAELKAAARDQAEALENATANAARIQARREREMEERRCAQTVIEAVDENDEADNTAEAKGAGWAPHPQLELPMARGKPRVYGARHIKHCKKPE